MTKRLADKVALVLGAGSIGPGWGMVGDRRRLRPRGRQVVCVDIDVEAAQDTAKLIADEDGVALALRADVTKAEDIARIVDTTRAMFGRIDIRQHVGVAAMGGVVEIEEAEWDRVFAVNLKSCYLAMKHVIPVMVAQGGG